MTTTELKKQYEDTVNRYLKAFCVKHNLNYDEAMNGWVANEVGGTVYISDYYIDFDDILRDINENIAERVFFDYYDYCMEAAHCGFTAPNYKSWLKGCPRLSKEQISAIKAAKQRADAAQHDLEKLIIDEQNAIGYKNPF